MSKHRPLYIVFYGREIRIIHFIHIMMLKYLICESSSLSLFVFDPIPAFCYYLNELFGFRPEGCVDAYPRAERWRRLGELLSVEFRTAYLMLRIVVDGLPC